jgi:hypothetical protein
MRVVQVWTLKRGILNPPEPLDEEHSDWVEQLWYERDNPDESRPMAHLRERELLRRMVID